MAVTMRMNNATRMAAVAALTAVLASSSIVDGFVVTNNDAIGGRQHRPHAETATTSYSTTTAWYQNQPPATGGSDSDNIQTSPSSKSSLKISLSSSVEAEAETEAAAGVIETFSKTSPSDVGVSPAGSTSTTAAAPLPSSAATPAQPVTAAPAAASTPASPTTTGTPTKITSMKEWDDVVINNPLDEVTIVYFSAKYCRTCKVFTRKLQVAVDQINDDRLRVATAELTENRQSGLFKHLDVKQMPTIQFYYKGELLTNLEGILPKNFDQVNKAMEYYLQRTSTF